MSEDFRRLANIRIREARVLHKALEHSGAYYLAGYSVECALKACILRVVRQYRMPDKRTVIDSHTHDINQLVEVAGLKPARDLLQAADPTFARNWALVREWTEASRYQTWDARDAGDMIRAVGQPKNGVLAWTKRHW